MTSDADDEPATVEELSAYLDRAYSCDEWEIGDEEPGGGVRGSCSCGQANGVYESDEVAERVLDRHLDDVEASRRAYLVGWFERHHPELPVHIDGVRVQ